ncbi:MAG: DUF962 domain-containing protein [Betaproteobacteria bacterium]|nr:DUF962 domain-containing protein [Betaproteobacteria bacterium]
MKTLLDQLSNYADYHRSERNITTHLIGVPMIVLALMVLLSRPAWVVSDLALSPAVFIVVVLLLYYLRLHIAMGLIMAALLVSGLFLSAWVATLDDAIWLATGVGGFLLGWVIQFVGHYFEGRKPAFFDDVMGLAIGPLFVVAEVLFKLGLFSELAQEVENRSGPVRP